ncbi:BMC domain-containing protein [Thermovenabulum gondwanense]|uniref:Ethanolamine utilization protein EutM n=1 Tax=Thermovenabulum gondwanense TaxID=520767 RepID=A0A162M606_9FIRM|nr:BMC domain-containing protein [Thermovenabulum gondwanense]KYO64154.1 Ethanolamine utilization protein EutM [Thermovenabulum gondwanense]
MENKAFGFIETYGLVPAIEATDAALKAANVKLYAFRYTTGGLVTTIITGDVGAVKAAVDTGFAAAKKIGKAISFNIIPRMDENSIVIIDGKVQNKYEYMIEEKTEVKETMKEEKKEEDEQNKEFKREENVVEDLETKEVIDNYKKEENEVVTEKEMEGLQDEKIPDDTDIRKDIKNRENTEKNEKVEKLEETDLTGITNKIKELLKNEQLKSILEQNNSIDKLSAKNLRRVAKELLGKEIRGEKVDSMRKSEILELLIKYFSKEV